MKKTNFTKGPWSVYDFDDGVSVVDSNGYSHVSVECAAIKPNWDEIGVNHWSESGDAHRELLLEEQYANAHLVAAAPEMYEMLNRIIANYQEASSVAELEGYETKYEQDKYFVESLLAKARGES